LLSVIIRNSIDIENARGNAFHSKDALI
jgi:hypothetical protein